MAMIISLHSADLLVIPFDLWALRFTPNFSEASRTSCGEANEVGTSRPAEEEITPIRERSDAILLAIYSANGLLHIFPLQTNRIDFTFFGNIGLSILGLSKYKYTSFNVLFIVLL
jgi:hypothetical protein